MKKLMLVLALACAGLVAQAAPGQEAAEWRRQAENVTIVRDDWGIAHVQGRSDADAVFGMIYAQAEDDFNRIEGNYLNALGRLAEAEGEAAIYRDLRMKLFFDPADLQAQYATSPAWLRALMDAWADGLNYYLSTHPMVRPRVITRFEPWMALSFSEGSIGGDIEKVALGPLEAFYGKAKAPAAPSGIEAPEAEPSGSNGFAFAPSITASKRAILWINPHTSFFFRSELQMTSGEGLNAYGAVTWGQFFVYQGFNERAGWMHTSSSVDNIDEYLETIVRKGNGYFYKYGTEERPVATRTITVPYRTADGTASRTFTVYRTHHGPIVRETGGTWVAARLMQEPLNALIQSVLPDEGDESEGVPRDDGPAHQLVEQHRLRGCRRQHRVLPRELHPEARPAVRLDPARRRQRPGDGMDRADVCRRIAHRPEPRQWLDPEHEQLAVLGVGAAQPEAGAICSLRRRRQREPAGRPRRPGAVRAERLHD